MRKLNVSQWMIVCRVKKVACIYDASVKPESAYSLNDCLKKGWPLQNKLWDIMIRTRLRPLVICRGIEKAFLQIRTRENEKDCLRFHWSEKANFDIIKIYQFTRLVFGLNQSPLILEGTLKTASGCSVNWLRERVNDDMYVEDFVTGGESTSEVNKIKGDSVKLFQRGVFKLHKWH